MKYKKGTKVEVLNKREVPSGSWWCAEIISGNGHTYSVRYDPAPSGASELVERVPRKVIRPCPPLVQDPITLLSGDVIEVFDNGSWKLAEVSYAVAGDRFSVRVLGSSRVFNAGKSDIRLRQCWKNNHWIVIEKDVRNSDSAKALNGRCQKRMSYQATSGSGRAENGEETTTFEEPKLMFIGGKRKVLQKTPHFRKPSHKVLKKTRIGGTETKWQHYLVQTPYSLTEEKGVSKTRQEMHPRKQNGDVNRSFTTPIEPEHSDSSVSSSCGSNDLVMFYSHPLSAGAMLDGGVLLDDDADSTGWSRF